MLWFISVVSGSCLSIQSLWISLYKFYLHLTTWKTGMVYGYIWKWDLSLAIFCVKCNSIPPLLIPAEVLLNMIKGEITLLSRNPYACISKWRCFHDNYSKLPMRDMQFLEWKWNPANELQCPWIISAQSSHFWRCLCSQRQFLKLFGKNFNNIIREIGFIITPTDIQRKKNSYKNISFQLVNIITN